MALTMNDVTICPLAGPEELDLFGGLTYVLDDELADWMWTTTRPTGSTSGSGY